LDRVEPFVSFRSPSPRCLILGVVIGPLLWLVGLLVAAIVFNRTRAIELGMLIAFASMVLSMVALLFLRAGRNRERRRYGAER
jgi:hypothetical protein